jgi:hypothetical protein
MSGFKREMGKLAAAVRCIVDATMSKKINLRIAREAGFGDFDARVTSMTPVTSARLLT